MEWPDNPFWDFSLWVYGNEDVPPICLRIQESHAADINLLLYCAWMGTRGYRLGEVDLASIVAAVDSWHREVVVTLRNLRTRLKFDTLGAPRALVDKIRGEFKLMELNAEHCEQIMLSGALKKRDQTVSDDVRDCAEFNMHLYLKSLGPPLQKSDLEGLAVISSFAVDAASSCT